MPENISADDQQPTAKPQPVTFSAEQQAKIDASLKVP